MSATEHTAALPPAATAAPLGGVKAVAGSHVLLRADTTWLLLPQAEVGAIEYLGCTLQPLLEAPGFLLRDDDAAAERFYVALDAGLRPQLQAPTDRYMATTLGPEGDGLSWCWNEARVLLDLRLQAQPLPRGLLGALAPVSHWLQWGGHLVFLTDAARLAAFALSEAQPVLGDPLESGDTGAPAAGEEWLPTLHISAPMEWRP